MTDMTPDRSNTYHSRVSGNTDKTGDLDDSFMIKENYMDCEVKEVVNELFTQDLSMINYNSNPIDRKKVTMIERQSPKKLIGEQIIL